MSRLKSPRHILITGASSGIGQALAEIYAAPGVVLGLSGRDISRLDRVKESCESRGAEVRTAAFDIRDKVATQGWIKSFDEEFPLDLLVANAGSTSTIKDSQDEESWQDIERILDTNVYGVFSSIYPAMQAMRRRGAGHIAIVSSLSGYVGMPISPSYSGSKAAVKVYGEALQGWLAPQGITVSVICPGFVASSMSDKYPGGKPFIVSTDKAARIIKSGLDRGRLRISFPFPLNLGVWSLSTLPVSVNLFIQRLLKLY